MNIERFERTVEKMEKKGISQLIVTSAPDLFYYLGKWIHSGERMVALYLNVKGEKKLIINEIIMNPKEFSGVSVEGYKDGDDPIGILTNIIDKNNKLGIDKNWASHFLLELMDRNPKLNFVVSSNVVDSIRMVKDEDEIEKLALAGRTVDKVMKAFIEAIPERFSEKEGQEKLQKLFKDNGAQGFSFEPIIAFGAHAANPHHINSDKLPEKGDSIIIDIGGINDDYCSDTTRTVFYGEPCEEAKRIYEIVKKANETAIESVRPGVTFSDIDKAARGVIEAEGYGEFFTHRTGHGLGMECHELPSVAEGNNAKLEPGNVFSIEPGIYIEGKYGVRIEDIVVVTKEGCRVLNSYPKDLYIIKNV